MPERSLFGQAAGVDKAKKILNLDLNANPTDRANVTTHPATQDPSVLGIDIGGSKLLCGLVDGDGIVTASERQSLCRNETAASLTEMIETLAGKLIDSCRACPPAAIGIAVPGLVDRHSGMWKHAPYSGIDDFPIAEALGRRFRIPVIIENDVNACALAEKAHGSCQQASDFLWITVSNGVGGAIFLNDRLYLGATGTAGEIGHTKVASPGRQCDCGQRGCLEAHASGRAIAMAYASRKGRDPDESPPDAAELAERARQNDAEAKACFREAGASLGRAIGNAVNLLDIPKVILGGGVASSIDLLMPALTEALRETVFPGPGRLPCVEPSGLGTHAALIGAAAITNEPLRNRYL